MENLAKAIEDNNRLLRAVLALQAADYERGAEQGAQRIELVLAASGLGYQDIAAVLGKKPDAVRMLLKRKKTI